MFKQRDVRLLVGSLTAVVALLIAASVSQARPTKMGDQVTLSMLSLTSAQAGWNTVLPSFENTYPNIKVNITYVPDNNTLYQLETTQLGAGNAPDILATSPGSGIPISVSTLARAGDLAPMIKVPWAKRSLPLVTSLNKAGKALYAFSPSLAPFGIYTNDSLFAKLGLSIPKTFAQLLTVCQKARAAGVDTYLLPGATQVTVQNLLVDMAVPTVYAVDKKWPAELNAGKVTFDGTKGWHQALQNFIDMNNAGCFQAGDTAATTPSVVAAFAQGKGLMVGGSGLKGTIDAGNPTFTYSFRPFPGGTTATSTDTMNIVGISLGINAHSSAQNQAAAQTFVNFVARPYQDGLYATAIGSLTQQEYRLQQVPNWMSDFTIVFKNNSSVISPVENWWNANIGIALETNQIGLLTGQTTIDSILNAMDAAHKQGHS